VFSVIAMFSFVSMGQVSALERFRINPSRFLAECHKRLLNQGHFVLLYFALLALELYLVSVFSCTVLFVSISQVIGCEDCLLHCATWGI